jgi:hypothetical protein
MVLSEGLSVTDEEIEKYGAAQGIDRMRRDFPRLRRRMEATGTAGQQVALGTDAGVQADLRVLEKLPEPSAAQRAKAHEIRDLLAAKGLMGDRPYKG